MLLNCLKMFLQLACLGAIILYKMDSALDLVISEKDSCYLEMQLLFTNDKMQELCGRLFQNQYPTVQCYPDSGEGYRKVTKQKKWCWYDSWHIIITVSVCLSHVNVHAKTAHTYTCMQACMHTHTHTHTHTHIYACFHTQQAIQLIISGNTKNFKPVWKRTGL